MAALTSSGRLYNATGVDKTNGPVAAETRVMIGGMVAVATTGPNAGYIVPASADSTLRVLGIAEETTPKKGVDISATVAGEHIVHIDQRRCLMNNSAGGDAITSSDRGSLCYVVDDQTVAITSNGGVRPVAGTIDSVGTDGVWVNFNRVVMPAPSQGTLVATLQVEHTDLTASATTQTIALLTDAPPGLYVVWATLDEVFAGGTIASMVIDIGDAGNPDLLADNVNVFTGATIAYGPLSGDVGNTIAIHNPAGTISVVFTSGTGDVDESTTGDITFELYRIA